MPLPDVIAGLIVAAVVLLGIRIAYRRGFRAALPLRTPDLDLLATKLTLNGTRWSVQLAASAEAAESNSLPETLEFLQAGSRVTARGVSSDGAAWQAEGVADGGELLCHARAVGGTQLHCAVWMLRSGAAADRLHGYCLCWDRGGESLGVREFELRRLAHVVVER